MVDWRRGSWTGSLNAWVRREVREHMRDNVAARRARYSVPLRLLRLIFANRTFGEFIVIYFIIALVAVVAEFAIVRYFPGLLPPWTLSTPGLDIKTLLTSVASYLISAQAGVLGVISIAIGVVALIASREGSWTDVQVYYHESLAFQVVASCIALLAVLCAQLLWPFQFLLHRFGEGTDSRCSSSDCSGCTLPG
jgi:hypothetical protein